MLFNQSLEERKVPDVWKLSIYVPVPKVMNDYRTHVSTHEVHGALKYQVS